MKMIQVKTDHHHYNWSLKSSSKIRNETDY